MKDDFTLNETSVFLQFDTPKFKLQTKICFCSMRLHQFLFINISDWNQSISQSIFLDLGTNEIKLSRELVMSSHAQTRVQTCQVMSKLSKICQMSSGRFKMYRQVKIIQNESLFSYAPALRQGDFNLGLSAYFSTIA